MTACLETDDRAVDWILQILDATFALPCRWAWASP